MRKLTTIVNVTREDKYEDKNNKTEQEKTATTTQQNTSSVVSNVVRDYLQQHSQDDKKCKEYLQMCVVKLIADNLNVDINTVADTVSVMTMRELLIYKDALEEKLCIQKAKSHKKERIEG